jgi:hypothetical protein
MDRAKRIGLPIKLLISKEEHEEKKRVAAIERSKVAAIKAAKEQGE